MNVKIIKRSEDYEAALARLSALMSLDPAPGSDEEEELELLALVIGDFERQSIDPVKPDPIEAILLRMDQRKLVQKDLVPYIGSISKVSEVLNRKRPLSLPMIRRLHEGLDIPAEILIEDGATNVAVVEEPPELDFSRFPLKEMRARGCFGDVNARGKELEEYAEDWIRRFMGGLLPRKDELALLRAPLHQRGDRQADEMALLAWRLCVLRKAQQAEPSRPYEPGSITPEWLRGVAKLSAFSEGPRLAQEHLARYGITFVVEKHFARTFLDGAAMLDGGRPVVALTLRHDRVDNFWFALLHELAHVSKHLSPARPLFLDDLDRPDAEAMEDEADAIAQEALIPAQMWKNARVRSTLSSEDAVEFATRAGIHPAIVAGRIRYEQKNFRLLSNLVGKTGQVSGLFVAAC